MQRDRPVGASAHLLLAGCSPAAAASLESTAASGLPVLKQRTAASLLRLRWVALPEELPREAQPRVAVQLLAVHQPIVRAQVPQRVPLQQAVLLGAVLPQPEVLPQVEELRQVEVRPLVEVRRAPRHCASR